jgi:hypothetical protein
MVERARAALAAQTEEGRAMSEDIVARLLFADLPVQKPPHRIETGGKVVQHCQKCRGTGRHRYSAYSGGYYTERFSEPCSSCGGGGRVLSPPPQRDAAEAPPDA